MSWNQPAYASPDIRDERVSAFLTRVYAWMFVGLLVTAGTAFAVASSPTLTQALIGNRLVFWVAIFAQIGVVFFLSARVAKMASTTAAGLFLLYSVLVGVTSSVVLLVYTATSIFSAFVVTAGMFGATAAYGTLTKRSLAGVGQFMFMGLIGIILASIVGIFWQNDMLQFVISVVGVIVLTGLTAWDAERLKQMAVAMPDGRSGTFAVVGALSLYLYFINLLSFLLRLTGNRRS